MRTPDRRIALVEYLNTRPFTEGLRRAGADQTFELVLGTPAQCARRFAEGEADISLCPVGALPGVGDYRLFGDHCIGAAGPVRTVALLSRLPLEQIRRVRLDDHSRTSNQLLRILAGRHWKAEWDYYFDAEETLPDSALMIGDKVFAAERHYPFKYDLAEAWGQLTGLPMVFAVWIARPEIGDEILEQLAAAFAQGMDWMNTNPAELTEQETDYLQHAISFRFGELERRAMDQYLAWAAGLKPIPFPVATSGR